MCNIILFVLVLILYIENIFLKKSPNRTLGLSSGNWIKLTVEKEGIYKIDAADLFALGFTIPQEQAGTIKIFGNGGMELSERVSDAVKNKMNELNYV